MVDRVEADNPQETTHTAQAASVFISYASQDKAVADAVCLALEQAGVACWIAPRNVIPGESYAGAIVHAIDGTKLNVLILSEHGAASQHVLREVERASSRRHPVVAFRIDAAPMPVDMEYFLNTSQWLDASSMGVERALPRLVDAVQRAIASPGHAAVAQLLSSSPSQQTPASKPAGRGLRLLALALGLLVTLGLAYFAVDKLWIAKRSAAEQPPTATPNITSDKSIAVLPFTDMSENKDAGFFADGVHEDLLTNLALVPELQVVSRTSVMQYRGTTKTMRQIGQELGVAYILEGSVRRAGNKIRVTGQLINTRTDQHVWAKNYDRDLTDLFNIQTTLSQEIATALSAALSPETMRRLERRPTGNTAAYDLFLQGRAVFNSAPSGNAKALSQSADFFRRAALLDPKFAAAWGELAVSYAFKEFWNIDETAELKAQGEDAIARAQALDPDSPEVIRLVGNYAYYAHRDYAKATAQYMRLAALQPNDPTVFSALGLIQRRQGRWSESLANLRKAAELDYGSIPYQRNLVSMLMIARRYPEAREVAQRLVALRPGNLDELLLLADLVYDTTDSLQAAQAILANLTPAQREDPDVIYRRKGWARDSGDLAEFKRLDEKQPYEEDGSPIVGAIFAGLVYWGAGDQPLARARVAPFLEEARKQVASTPDNYLAWGNLGQLELLSGQPDAAMEHLAKATRLLPPSRDALAGPGVRFWYLSGCAMTGRKDEALTGLAELVRQPTGIPLIDIRTSLAFLPLRGDPRFQAILNDPKSRAQLF
jgi:TolB-like protein/cytochrome c-type biogenesis protein CcmH/NrfG